MSITIYTTYFTVYKITNLINNKIYIGVHKTNNLNDNYMGSGKILKHAIEKYGIENFIKEILFIYNNSEEMFAKEKELVNDQFILMENTYNIKLGGLGGFDHINNSENKIDYVMKGNLNSHVTKRILLKDKKYKDTLYSKILNSHGRKESNKKTSARLKENWANGIQINPLKHTDETKRKMSDSQKGKHVGNKNSQFGTMWIYSELENRNMKINKTDIIPDGWIKGRKIK